MKKDITLLEFFELLERNKRFLDKHYEEIRKEKGMDIQVEKDVIFIEHI